MKNFNKNLNIIILAAGRGKRLGNLSKNKPKAMINLLGKPLIEYSVSLAESLKAKPIIVVGYKKEMIIDYLKNRAQYVEQKELLGTGHAVMAASKILKNKSGITLVYFADNPLWSLKTAKKVIKTFIDQKLTMIVTSAKISADFMYGRVIRDNKNQVKAIIEAKDCNQKQLKINEMHSSFYAFDNKWLFANLAKIKNQNVQKEYYLTDTLGLAVSQNKKVEGIWAYKKEEAYGINTTEDLKKVEKYLQNKGGK